MTENFRNLEDEPFPSFLSTGSCDHATLGNLTLGSALGVPVAASTVAKIRTAGDNRCGKSLDEDLDMEHLQDDELELYFNKLMPPAMQRGHVEGQEIPACVEQFCSSAGADGIVYQNEEGQWVTDLAYYSSFAKEVGQTSVPEAVTEQLQTEAFLAGDQEEFEKEHHFMQEEEIEAVNANLNLGDTSWKVPSSGHVLMRASQVSSKFESDDQNYLRISLGEFFQQRSEALGCLGSNDDYVKRPSFGYIITSPEKREPFALIRPSDFSSRATSVHSETLLLSDADKTMNTVIFLEKVCVCVLKDASLNVQAEDQTFAQDEACGVSEDSPNGSSDLLLSISTIASAIADASVSSDPAQLAAMIMELAKKHRSKARDQANNAQSYHLSPLHDQNSMLEALQSSTTGNMSILDMEKYLKIAEISSSDCEASASQSCFDILGWADGLAESQRKPQLPVDGVSALVTVSLPSTSPLTHSSPSQTSFPSGGLIDKSPPHDPLSPQSHCSSPSLSRLTYLSINEGHGMPTPDHKVCLSSILIWEVVVPDEIKFPNACCVGIASQTTLSIFNPSDHWQTVGILVTNLSVDGVKVDPLPYQCLIVKNKTIIGPKSTEEQKVLFVAPRAGLYQCTLSVSSWPASAESETVTHAGMFAKRVAVIAVAETPAVEVDIGKSSCLDFGDLPGGSTRALPLRLVNKTRATLPIRLVISANASAWRCFTFSKSPVAMVSEGALLSSGTMPTLSAPSVMNHVLHSSYGDNPEVFMVWVHFHAPQKYLPSSGELGPADDFSARVDIEVDSPGPSHVIQSVCLRARCGTARVHAPKDLQTICLQAPVSHSTKQALPLKNAGNIDVQLRLKVYCRPAGGFSNDNDNCFSVKPEELFLRAGHEQSIHISFNPQDNQKHRESVLTILVLPCGPQYEVVLRGEVVSTEPGKAASLPAAIPQSQVPPILSNKQFMAWGGVTLGRAVQQKLVLRNNSPTAAQQLRLLIRGQDQDCFQLQSSFGQEERLSRHRDLTLRPKEDATVHLLFAPTRVAYMLAKLEIKQSAVRPSQPGVKFTIPLSGYGGTSNIILEDLRKRSDCYVALMTGVAAGRVSKLCVCVRNTGSRAAYVKAVVFSDLQGHKIMNPAVVSLAPSQFVLKERTQEKITFCMNFLFTLFCGDEVSRQQYRRLLQSKPEGGKRVLSENTFAFLVHKTIMSEFVTEIRTNSVFIYFLLAFDLPQRPNEVQIFYSNMNLILLTFCSCIHQTFLFDFNLFCLSGFGHTDRQHGNVSLDVLPVKGPPLTSTDVKHTAEQKGTWSIKPDQMVLTAPSISGDADTKHVQIFNPSSHVVNFELSWPAHCLTITPQHGVIEPESHIQILVSPNPSLATKTSLLPWSGHIYIQCDGQQKFVKVQIRKDLAMDVSVSGGSSDKSLHPLPPQAETPPMMGVKPQSRTSSMAHVEIKNRTLVFPTTQSGESSECFLDVENKGEEVRWYISSFAPPYVKGVDSSGDVYRATYTAFRCARVSGSLGPQEKMQIAITFLPRDCGDYAQFWDIECHPVADPQQKSRVRFQLCGTVIVSGTNQGDCSLVRIESTMKTRKKSDFATTKGGVQDVPKRGVYAPQDVYTFPTTRVGEASTLKVNFRNNSIDSHELKFISPRAPFHIKHSKYSLRSQHYINLPVQFKPTATGRHVGLLVVQTDSGAKLAVELTGESLAQGKC
uniref:Centrosomal protein 192 n=1 Tax=Denticeps clupeoides TaxID=299321 RepID=A0AAY4DD36_9TELE